MIITCNNCNKKFNIDSNLISDKGRLLQCASCDHKWFFKKEVLDKTVSPIVKNIDSDTINVFDHNNSSNNYEINPSDLVMDEIEADTKEELDEKIDVNNKSESQIIFDLTAKIEQLIKNEIRINNLRNKSLERINHYSWINKALRLYK